VTVNGNASGLVELPDEYRAVDADSDGSYDWIDLPGHPRQADQIKLTIRSVYPGSRDQETCINKILLRQWLNSKPKIMSGIDGHELP